MQQLQIFCPFLNPVSCPFALPSSFFVPSVPSVSHHTHAQSHKIRSSACISLGSSSSHCLSSPHLSRAAVSSSSVCSVCLTRPASSSSSQTNLGLSVRWCLPLLLILSLFGLKNCQTPPCVLCSSVLKREHESCGGWETNCSCLCPRVPKRKAWRYFSACKVTFKWTLNRGNHSPELTKTIYLHLTQIFGSRMGHYR